MPPASKFRLDDAIAALSAAGRMAATSIWSPHPKPTPAQARANDYPVGYATWQGIPVRIENPAHSIREGRDPGGKPWRNLLAAAYGDFPGTLGADGDAVDVFIGPFPESSRVWILNQHTANGGFDEHKVLAGFTDARHATDAYRNSYSPGWSRFDPPIPASLAQLRHWLKHADKSRPFSLDQVPLETDMTDTTAIAPAMRRVFWGSEGDPGAGRTWASVVYDLRLDDAGQDLLTDPLTMADVLEGQTIEVLDAMVVQAGKLMPKMAAFQRILNAAGTDLQALTMQLSDVVKRFGGAHVAAIFELSDGQTITLWFHNPDATPNKFGPADDLVSWKVQLNKKDVTIVVAPEKGEDLNLREVGRRLMKLAGRNSAAFAKANALRAATMQTIAELKAAVPEKQAALAGLLHQIDVAKVAKADREANPSTPDPTPEDLAAKADAAYRFATATTEFKAWVSESIEQEDYSPFASAKAMDKQAQAGGAAIAWDYNDDDESVPIGVITRGGATIGRVDMGDDGKAMVFVGAEGEERVKTPSGATYFYSDDDAGDMVRDLLHALEPQPDPVIAENAWNGQVAKLLQGRVESPIGFVATHAIALVAAREAGKTPEEAVDALLFAAQPEPQPAPNPPEVTPDPVADSPDAAYLRDVARGAHDGEDLGALLSKLSTAIMALSDAGALAGAADQAANDAITHWVELDQAANG